MSISTIHSQISGGGGLEPADAEAPGAERSGSASAGRSSPILAPAKLVTWLGASAVGLGIVLAATGFLALAAHDAMLGIPTTERDRLSYIIIGGLFFSRTILLVLIALVTVSTTWLVLVLLVAFLTSLSLAKSRSLRFERAVCILGAGTLLVAACVVLWHLSGPLQLQDILLTDPEHASSATLSALRGSDDAWLQREYGLLAVMILALAVAGALSRHRYPVDPATRSGKGYLLWRGLRGINLGLLAIGVFLLPRVYGVLTLSNRYPVVVALLAPGSEIPANRLASRRIFLMREGGTSMLLYDRDSRTLIRVRLDVVVELRLGAPAPVL